MIKGMDELLHLLMLHVTQRQRVKPYRWSDDECAEFVVRKKRLVRWLRTIVARFKADLEAAKTELAFEEEELDCVLGHLEIRSLK